MKPHSINKEKIMADKIKFVKGKTYKYADIAEVADEIYMIEDNQVNTIGLNFISLEHNERDIIHSFVLVSTSGSDYNYECVYTDNV